MNFTQEQYIILGGVAIAAFILGTLIAWALTSGRAKAQLAKITAEKEAEAQRVEDTKQRLASTQKDLQALRDAELTLKQELSSLRSELKTGKEFTTGNESLLVGLNSIDEQLKNFMAMSKKTPQPETFIDPIPGAGDFADLSTPPAFTEKSALHTEFEGFTADSEGSGI